MLDLLGHRENKYLYISVLVVKLQKIRKKRKSTEGEELLCVFFLYCLGIFYVQWLSIDKQLLNITISPGSDHNVSDQQELSRIRRMNINSLLLNNL